MIVISRLGCDRAWAGGALDETVKGATVWIPPTKETAGAGPADELGFSRTKPGLDDADLYDDAGGDGLGCSFGVPAAEATSSRLGGSLFNMLLDTLDTVVGDVRAGAEPPPLAVMEMEQTLPGDDLNATMVPSAPGAGEWETTLLHTQKLFPDLPPDRVESGLREAAGNVEAAVEALLSDTEPELDFNKTLPPSACRKLLGEAVRNLVDFLPTAGRW